MIAEGLSATLGFISVLIALNAEERSAKSKEEQYVRWVVEQLNSEFKEVRQNFFDFQNVWNNNIQLDKQEVHDLANYNDFIQEKWKLNFENFANKHMYAYTTREALVSDTNKIRGIIEMASDARWRYRDLIKKYQPEKNDKYFEHRKIIFDNLEIIKAHVTNRDDYNTLERK